MSGTPAGGAKAMITIRAKYPADYFQTIGSKGGKAGKGSAKGFGAGAEGRARAIKYGSIAGKTKASGYKRNQPNLLAVTRLRQY